MAREQIYLIVKRHLQCLKAGVPSNCHALIVGPSGSGKTYTIRKALELYDASCPIIVIDASQLAPPGWKGTSIQDIIAKHGKSAQEAIIYIDEFDKVLSNNNSSHADYMVSLQTCLLALLDKTDNNNIFTDTDLKSPQSLTGFSTKNMTFIFSGVFRDVRVSTKGPLGFNGTNPQTEECALDHAALIELGFLKELVYRIPYIIKVDPYTRDELRVMLRKHFGYRQAVDLFGLKLDEEAMLDYITNHPAGARAINIYLGTKDLESESLLARRHEQTTVTKVK